ncbi:MAG: tRNA pseudouridine(55) synthase [uncultured Cytophagales bacterium]|uniref:tRNA pseudouridine synthase B n=1 Tax=uncultured Cytophagales bacterium TaxID=158755 RepID=A0A6J4HV66_9SPHI|nr:MAG: tRNA pseudouridine(55) synthase [uncultured Cytophagales bacterium]
MNESYEEGRVILIDKPSEWTSFDVVNKIRRTIRVRKVGHAGTLDPLATGLLIICTGKMTKQIDSYQAQEKEYTGRIMLGKTTPSFDRETPVDAEFDISHVTPDMVIEAAGRFVGLIEQIPPMYSAVRVDGKRMYVQARKGRTVEIPARQVTISHFDVTDVTLPTLSFRVVCSKGTYIRSLVRDLGVALSAGAYLDELRRTRIGEFRVDDAQTISDFVQQFQQSV